MLPSYNFNDTLILRWTYVLRFFPKIGKGPLRHSEGPQDYYIFHLCSLRSSLETQQMFHNLGQHASSSVPSGNAGALLVSFAPGTSMLGLYSKKFVGRKSTRRCSTGITGQSSVHSIFWVHNPPRADLGLRFSAILRLGGNSLSGPRNFYISGLKPCKSLSAIPSAFVISAKFTSSSVITTEQDRLGETAATLSKGHIAT